MVLSQEIFLINLKLSVYVLDLEGLVVLLATVLVGLFPLNPLLTKLGMPAVVEKRIGYAVIENNKKISFYLSYINIITIIV